MIGRVPLAAAIAWLAASGLAPAAQQTVPLVEPAELTRHPEYIGREVAVDDRVKFFRQHPDRGFDQMFLKRANVTFRLPTNLRPERNDDAHVVRVQGILREEEGEFYCDVTAMTILPRDLDRLEQGLAALRPDDYERRAAWARWAEQRARSFRGESAEDKALLERARTLESEALQIEADHAATDDRPALWLRLAARARDRKIGEPTPSALAHRAFRARLDQAKTVPLLERLTAEIEAFFPKAKTPGGALPPHWERGYRDDPAGTYRSAPDTVRAALDRQLLADVRSKSLLSQAASLPKASQDKRALIRQAQKELPDHPEVGREMNESYLEEASAHPETLRRDDAEALAKEWENRGQPDRARDLMRRFREDQRSHLSSADAEGRVSLARQYRDIGDEPTAKELCLEALAIDPKYREPENLLRTMGYKKDGNEWVKLAAARSPEPGPETGEGQGTPAARPGGELFQGLTAAQVRAKMGEPDQVVRSATQGALLEQWIYRGLKGTEYINLVRRPHMTQPTVEAYYSLGNR
jgi:hypothetical protein